jgi:hypothetical protein
VIKLVISGGDSFTFGAELTDINWVGVVNTPSPGSWANLVANKFNAKHINTALSGRSNSFIVRHIIKNIYEALQHDYKPEEIFVQVMWTFVARQEIVISSNTQRMDSPWFPIDPYVVGDESKASWFKKIPKDTENWQSANDDMHNRYLINKDLGLVDYAKAYDTVVSNLHDTYTSLSEILSLQELLDYNGIRYMFTYVSEHVMNGLMSKDKFAKGLHSFIEFNEWYKFPGDKEFMGFGDWAKANGYSFATSHPLEKAHEDAAELIYDHISNIRR